MPAAPNTSSPLLRSLRVGFWLGWKIESNWTDPLLFLIYAVVRPVGAALILVAMFFAVSGGERGPLLDFFVVGSAFWPFVLAGIQGLAMAVIEDREHWRMTRPVYTSPISWRAFLIGRSLAVTSSVGLGGAVVTLLTGWLVLGVPLELTAGRVAYLLAATALGLAAVLGVGLLTVSYALSVSSEAWRMPEAVSGSLYLLSGAVFPVGVLPDALELVARAVPLTWWLEAVRRAVLPPGARLSFPALGDGAVLGLLAATTAVAVVAAVAVFGWAERRARRLGTLDRESGF